jgi:hypothetical protein
MITEEKMQLLVSSIDLYLGFEEIYQDYLDFCACNRITSVNIGIRTGVTTTSSKPLTYFHRKDYNYSYYEFFRKKIFLLMCMFTYDSSNNITIIEGKSKNMERKLIALAESGYFEEAKKEVLMLKELINETNPNEILRKFTQNKEGIDISFCLYMLLSKFNNYTLVNLNGEIIEKSFNSLKFYENDYGKSIGFYFDYYPGGISLSDVSFLEGNRIDKLNQFVDSSEID